MPASAPTTRDGWVTQRPSQGDHNDLADVHGQQKMANSGHRCSDVRRGQCSDQAWVRLLD